MTLYKGTLDVIAAAANALRGAQWSDPIRLFVHLVAAAALSAVGVSVARACDAPPTTKSVADWDSCNTPRDPVYNRPVKPRFDEECALLASWCSEGLLLSTFPLFFCP